VVNEQAFMGAVGAARAALEYAVSAHANESGDFKLAAEQLRELAELRHKAAAWDALQPVAQAALESWANDHDERSQYEARAALRKLLEYHE
jgi:hypothetical protein